SSSTERWNDVPRGTMDEVSSHVRLDLPLIRRQGRPKDCSTLSSNPMMEGPWCRFRREARARERHRYCAGGESESLKALDPKRPIREADSPDGSFGPRLCEKGSVSALISERRRFCDH